MVGKEGDELGVAPIKDRLETDQKLMEKAMELHGIPQIFLRNAVPAEMANDHVDDYELTAGYDYEWDAAAQKVVVKESPWKVADDNGKMSVSLQAPAVAVSLIKQLVQALGI